jgi:hypothetical protein
MSYVPMTKRRMQRGKGRVGGGSKGGAVGKGGAAKAAKAAKAAQGREGGGGSEGGALGLGELPSAFDEQRLGALRGRSAAANFTKAYAGQLLLGKSIGFADTTAQGVYKVVQAKYMAIPGEEGRQGGINVGLMLLGELKQGPAHAIKAWKIKGIGNNLVNREKGIIDFTRGRAKGKRY